MFLGLGFILLALLIIGNRQINKYQKEWLKREQARYDAMLEDMKRKRPETDNDEEK
jgi:predicted negative regulator of RcsB-dependent stress response